MIILRNKNYSLSLENIIKKLKTSGHFITGKISQLFHKNTNPSHIAKAIIEQKSFSNIRNDYFKEIPGYYLLWKTEDVCKDAIIKLNLINSSSGFQTFIKEFPFISIVSPMTINKWRQDYKDEKEGDCSEIFFQYGTELVYIWDFERKNWYVKDTTYKPTREFLIGPDEKSITDLVIKTFDPEKDDVLRNKIELIRNTDNGKFNVLADNIEKYCSIVRNSIKL